MYAILKSRFTFIFFLFSISIGAAYYLVSILANYYDYYHIGHGMTNGIYFNFLFPASVLMFGLVSSFIFIKLTDYKRNLRAYLLPLFLIVALFLLSLSIHYLSVIQNYIETR